MLTVQTSSLNSQQLLDRTDVLAVVDFDAAPGHRPTDPRRIITPLDTSAALREVWVSNAGEVTTGRSGDILYAQSPDETVGTLILADNGEDLETLAYQAYSQLLTWLDQHEHRQLWRVWNYFSRINTGEGDSERYRRFSLGRQRALRESSLPDRALPPATAIGCAADQVFLMFIAGSEPGKPIENPRQISAYRYPRQYGPASPSFARAAKVGPADTEGTLIVSGTASIVGHETQHEGDWQRQLEETFRNLTSLTRLAGTAAAPSSLRVYARPSVPVDEVTARIRQEWGANTPIIPLYGEICRRDLLLEIEGVWPLATAKVERHAATAGGTAIRT